MAGKKKHVLQKRKNLVKAREEARKSKDKKRKHEESVPNQESCLHSLSNITASHLQLFDRKREAARKKTGVRMRMEREPFKV